MDGNERKIQIYQFRQRAVILITTQTNKNTSHCAIQNNNEGKTAIL